MNISIRQAETIDGARIAEIYNQGIQGRMATFETDLRTVQELQRWLDGHPHCPALVSTVEGLVVGFAMAGEYRPRPCYQGIGGFSIYVDENFQKLGIGKLLMDSLVEEAQKRGYWKLVSRIFDFNIGSRNLCQATGFREVGIYEKHGKLDGKWIDCVIVEKLITENID